MNAVEQEPHCGPGIEEGVDLLDSITPGEAPIPLRHGAVDLVRHGPVDIVRVRAATGTIEIALTAAGPQLRLRAVDVEIAAEGRMSLAGSEISLRSKGRLEIACDGQMVTSAGAGRHTHVGGPERLEAETIEMQSSGGGMAIRARDEIAIDGERIGLNSLDLPEPFSWSSIAEEEP